MGTMKCQNGHQLLSWALWMGNVCLAFVIRHGVVEDLFLGFFLYPPRKKLNPKMSLKILPAQIRTSFTIEG